MCKLLEFNDVYHLDLVLWLCTLMCVHKYTYTPKVNLRWLNLQNVPEKVFHYCIKRLFVDCDIRSWALIPLVVSLLQWSAVVCSQRHNTFWYILGKQGTSDVEHWFNHSKQTDKHFNEGNYCGWAFLILCLGGIGPWTEQHLIVVLNDWSNSHQNT